MRRLRLILVEDEMIVAEDLRYTLSRLGYAIEGVFPTGERAIAAAAHIRPDLALVDIRLAGVMDGIETARQLRSRFGIPIVFATAHSDAATLSWTRDLADGFVFKPFDECALVSAIEEAVRKQRAAELPRENES